MFYLPKIIFSSFNHIFTILKLHIWGSAAPAVRPLQYILYTLNCPAPRFVPRVGIPRRMGEVTCHDHKSRLPSRWMRFSGKAKRVRRVDVSVMMRHFPWRSGHTNTVTVRPHRHYIFIHTLMYIYIYVYTYQDTYMYMYICCYIL